MKHTDKKETVNTEQWTVPPLNILRLIIQKRHRSLSTFQQAKFFSC